MKPIYVFESAVSNLAISEAVKTMKNGWIGLGNKTKEFEYYFANYLCGKEYNHHKKIDNKDKARKMVAVGLNSATAALHLSMIIAKVSGYKVATTPMTFVSTNHAILYCKAKPYFIDVDDNMNMDLNLLEKTIRREGLRFVVLVHYAGNPILWKDINYLKQRYEITVIEDCAHALGARYENGVMVGSCGKYNIFSLHAVKNLATPDGGFLTSNDMNIVDMAKKLRWLGISKDTISRTNTSSTESYSWYYDVEEIGYKYHMNDVVASIGLEHLVDIESANDYRRGIISRYSNEINNEVRILKSLPSTLSSGHMAVAVLSKKYTKNDRNNLIAKLKADYNIHPGVHYTPNNMFPMYKAYKASTPNAFDLYERILTLPCHLKMTNADVSRVILAVNSLI